MKIKSISINVKYEYKPHRFYINCKWVWFLNIIMIRYIYLLQIAYVSVQNIKIGFYSFSLKTHDLQIIVVYHVVLRKQKKRISIFILVNYVPGAY